MRQTTGEEIANSVSHGLGLLASLAATPVLIYAAVQRGSTGVLVGVCVFGASMIMLYLASTLYHALTPERAKRIWKVLDHGAIYLLIAGTYTPFTLGVLKGAWGWTLLGLVWGMAVLGVVLKSVGGARSSVVSTLLYLAMGWLILIAIRPLWLNLPPAGLLWLLAGGLAYTAGIGFFAARRLPYAHFIWHLFVLLGTACHFVAVYRYAIP